MKNTNTQKASRLNFYEREGTELVVLENLRAGSAIIFTEEDQLVHAIIYFGINDKGDVVGLEWADGQGFLPTWWSQMFFREIISDPTATLDCCATKTIAVFQATL